jgi:2,3-dihydro-2,3-dihydroxybenzoate dehydrogenase
MALELAEHGIRVNSVAPGTTLTPFNQEALTRPGEASAEARIWGDSKKFRPGIPLRRISQPDQVADAVTFLLSDRASHITGQSLRVDGGESII